MLLNDVCLSYNPFLFRFTTQIFLYVVVHLKETFPQGIYKFGISNFKGDTKWKLHQ